MQKIQQNLVKIVQEARTELSISPEKLAEILNHLTLHGIGSNNRCYTYKTSINNIQ